MPLTACEGFKYPGSLNVQAIVPGNVNYDPTNPVFNRVAGRDGRYALHLTQDETSGTMFLAAPQTATGASLSFAANHILPSGTSASYYGIFGIGFIADYSWRVAFSIAPDRLIGEDSVTYSGSGPWEFFGEYATPGWHWWNIQNDPVSSTGVFQVYRDGILVARMVDQSFTGGFTHIAVTMGNVNSTSRGYAHIADMLVHDEPVSVPDSAVGSITLASTTAAGWTGSDGNQVDNHLLVSGTGPTYDTATYVQADSTGLTDTYTVSGLPAGVTDVHGVQLSAHGDSAAGGYTVNLGLNSKDESFIPLSGTTLRNFSATNPDTASPWTPAEVNSMTVGLKT